MKTLPLVVAAPGVVQVESPVYAAPSTRSHAGKPDPDKKRKRKAATKARKKNRRQS